MTAATRLRAFLPNGADQGPLPSPDSVNASYVLNDVGALTFAYAPQAARSALLGQPLEVAVEVSTDVGVTSGFTFGSFTDGFGVTINANTWFEPPNSRFVYVADGRNPLDPGDRYSVECKSYVWRLSKAVVLPNGLLNADGKRAFLSSNVGTILKTLLTEAQTRGALTGVVHSSFSTTTDSSGAAWSKTLTIYYEPGIDYLTILLNLAEQGFCDFRTQGRSLQVYNPDTTLAVDRTVGSPQVTLRAGRDLTEAPFRRTWEALADFGFFAGGEGSTYSFTNPGASTPWGRQETFISNGSVSDAGTMASLTQAQLAQTDVERIEHTRGLDFTRAADMPFTHYGVGDHIWSAVNGSAPERLRVRQLTLTNNDRNALSGNVVLNDRFLEADVRQQRRISGITNGASSGDGTGGPPPTTDSKPPAQVTGLAGSSTAYMGPGGFAQAQVSLTWSPVTTNFDGTPASDIDHYEVFRRLFGSGTGTEKHFRDTVDASLDDSPYVTESNWWFSVRAVDQTGNRGAKSTEVSVGMASDATPPQAPSTPVVTAKLGQLSIAYDGQPATGSWPADLDHVDVHVSTTNDFTPTAGTKFDTLYGKGVTVYTTGTYGIPLYVKLIAVDRAGNESPASAQATGTPTRLVGTDISADAITYEQLAFKDPDNVIRDGSFETASYRTAVGAVSAAAWTFSTSDKFHGDWGATINAATNPSTQRLLVLMSSGDAQQILATSKLFCRFAYKGSVGATGVFRLVVEWTSDVGAVTTSTLVATTKNGTWQQVAAQLTAPAATETFRVYFELDNTGTTGTYWVDAVEVRRTVGTSIIEDAAITNALIANLAVNDAKIANLDVGKLVTGSLTADVLVAGSIKTASSGSRVEMTSTGIRMFRGTDVTAHWNPTYGQLRIYATTDATHTSTGHGLQFGDDDDQNLIVDDNEVMSRFNGTFGTLSLNREGGAVLIGGRVGGFPSDADYGTIPANDNHIVAIRSSVQIVNTSDGGYADEFPPFSIGILSDNHLWFDSNEIAAATADGPNHLFIQPPVGVTDHNFSTFMASNHIDVKRSGTDQAEIGCGPADVALQFVSGQINSRNYALTGNQSMGASAFNVLSQADTKERFGDIPDPLEVVRRVKSHRWQFRDDINPEDHWHYGPMLEDLPVEMQTAIGEDQRGYDVASLVGLLWAAVAQLAEDVHAKR